MKRPLPPLGRLIVEGDECNPAVLCPHCGSSMVWKFGLLGRYVLRHFGVKPIRCVQDKCVERQKLAEAKPILNELYGDE